jgi:nitrile hydratase accessory protein
MTVLLHERGLFAWNEWTQALAREIANAPDKDYYRAWLSALEGLLVAKQVALPDQLPALAQAWLAAAEATPHGKPVMLPDRWRRSLQEPSGVA